MPTEMILLSPCLHQLPHLHYGLKNQVNYYRLAKPNLIYTQLTHAVCVIFICVSFLFQTNIKT